MRKFLTVSILILNTLVSYAQITEDVLVKQIIVESNNVHTLDGLLIESDAGALGIAQFMPETWQWLKDTKKIPNYYVITNKYHQKKAQKVFMNYLYNFNYGASNEDKLVLACASYNAGVHRVHKLVKNYGTAWRQHLPQETQTYLIKLNL